MSYNVYTAEFQGHPNHISIFVLTAEQSDKSGRLFHVTGSIVVGGGGMTYEERLSVNPQDSGTYEKGTYKRIGSVDVTDMNQFRAICQSIPPPGPQMTLGGQLANPAQPLRRCTEWVEETVDALTRAGVLRP